MFTLTAGCKAFFSPKKQLNVDFMRMHDHRDVHLTYIHVHDRAKCGFHEAPVVSRDSDP